ncbi:MAG: cyclic nucleotide-binding domain-containing protein [Deltaproteobacteria bacterium]|nr:cyclic nucleotide-binding domain-containing protein [Deltaproteobacteria bacterium]
MKDPQVLQKIFLFQDLETEELTRLLRFARSCRVAAREVVIHEGEQGDSMYIMCEGEVEITKRLTLALAEDTPKERVMIRLRAEDGVVFGEMALLENDLRSATVTALTDCYLLEIRRNDFLDFINQDQRIGCKILLRLAQNLSRNLRKTNLEVVKLTTALAIALGG